MFDINFSKILGYLIVASPREMKYSEMQYSKRYRAVSRFLVNSFCSYGSNFERNPSQNLRIIQVITCISEVPCAEDSD